MLRSDFEKIFDRALGANVWSLNSGLKCFECGKPIRLSKIYFVNGKKRKYNNYKFVCSNRNKSHKFNFISYSVDYLDMFEGFSRSFENDCMFTEKPTF